MLTLVCFFVPTGPDAKMMFTTFNYSLTTFSPWEWFFVFDINRFPCLRIVLAGPDAKAIFTTFNYSA